MWVWQISQDKAERLEPSGIDPKSSDNRTTQDPIQLEEQHGPRDQRVTVGATQPPPTPREDPEHPRKGGGHVATSPGRPA